MITHPSGVCLRRVYLFEPIHDNSWQKAKEKLLLPLEERIGVMPPCLCSSQPENTGLNLDASIKIAKSIAELCPIVRNASLELSFTGKLNITVKNYEGRADIDALAKRVMGLIKENPEFDQRERSHGKTIAPLITALYQKSDELIRESCLITRICVFLRNLPIWYDNLSTPRTCSKTRWNWFTCETQDGLYIHKTSKVGYHQVFTWYTKKQHEGIFFYSFRPSHGRGGRYLKSEIEPKLMSHEEILSAAENEDTKFDALTSAAAQGFEDTLEKLLSNKDYSWGLDDSSAQALILAAMHKHWGCVDLLLKYKSILPEAIIRIISISAYYNEQTKVEELRDYFFNEAAKLKCTGRPETKINYCKIMS